MNEEMRIPAEVFPPGEYIRDEMMARGWSPEHVHNLLGNDPVRCCAFDLAAYVDDKNLILDEKTASDLAELFGSTQLCWLRLDRMWRGVSTDTGSVT